MSDIQDYAQNHHDALNNSLTNINLTFVFFIGLGIVSDDALNEVVFN